MSTLTISGRDLHYEVHGAGQGRERLIAMGGWGTYCHGGTEDLPRVVMAGFEVVLVDYRGLGESTDTPEAEASTASYAEDVAALLDHLGGAPVHVLGLVGMGACIGQELAVARPDLVRSLVMTGCWAYADAPLRDQLESLRQVHVDLGFAAFQRLCAALSFDGEFYSRNRDRLLGPTGAWAGLRGRAAAHSRLVDACLAHDVRDRLAQVEAPALVLHAGLDPITTARHTRLLESLLPRCSSEFWPDLAHVIAGREQRGRFDALLRRFYSGLGAGAT